MFTHRQRIGLGPALLLSFLLFGAAGAQAFPLRLLSFNAWLGASEVDDGVDKVVAAVTASGADVVGFQETRGELATQVATALGWFALQGPSSVALVSRFPITEVFPLTRDSSALGARLRVADAPARDVIVWVAHLGYTDYGPYTACDGGSARDLTRGEKASGRVPQIRDIMRRMRRQLLGAAAVPVFLLGDFNAPSHLDWVPAAASLHCGVSVRWPVSRKVEQSGMIDVFRSVEADPLANPGDTWSAVYPAPDEPQDRIDFVYAKGAVPVAATPYVVGTPAAYPDHVANEWPSDHRAVLATVDVTPTAGVVDRAPQLVLDRSVYGSGDPIAATVGSGPGNSTDWIGIFHSGDTPGPGNAVTWRYLSGSQSVPRRGVTAAAVTFPAGALAPGDYVAHFLYADGYGAIAPPVTFQVVD